LASEEKPVAYSAWLLWLFTLTADVD